MTIQKVGLFMSRVYGFLAGVFVGRTIMLFGFDIQPVPNWIQGHKNWQMALILIVSSVLLFHINKRPYDASSGY